VSRSAAGTPFDARRLYSACRSATASTSPRSDPCGHRLEPVDQHQRGVAALGTHLGPSQFGHGIVFADELEAELVDVEHLGPLLVGERVLCAGQSGTACPARSAASPISCETCSTPPHRLDRSARDPAFELATPANPQWPGRDPPSTQETPHWAVVGVEAGGIEPPTPPCKGVSAFHAAPQGSDTTGNVATRRRAVERLATGSCTRCVQVHGLPATRSDASAVGGSRRCRSRSAARRADKHLRAMSSMLTNALQRRAPHAVLPSGLPTGWAARSRDRHVAAEGVSANAVTVGTMTYPNTTYGPSCRTRSSKSITTLTSERILSIPKSQNAARTQCDRGRGRGGIQRQGRDERHRRGFRCRRRRGGWRRRRQELHWPRMR